jgi:AcrR family transcriptional regulator
MEPHNSKFVRKSKAERRTEIVEAAVQLLGKYGVQGTTVSRIASAVGIARGALYQHFPNREAVLEAALASMDGQPSRWIAQSSGPDVAARLLNMGELHSSQTSTEYTTFVRPFYWVISSNREVALAKRIIERQQGDFHYLVELVDEGKRQGSIAEDLDSGDVAWSLLLHAWGEDIARLMGVDQFITEGASQRILRRLLGTYAAVACRPASDEDAASCAPRAAGWAIP